MLAFLLFGLDIYISIRIAKLYFSPSLLMNYTISPLILGLGLSTLIISMFNDDRQSGLVEYLIAEGFKPSTLFITYLYYNIPYLSLTHRIRNISYIRRLLSNVYYSI
ncbi:hypothetical protein HFC64_01105 [Saccharolobus solfataricus]|uniref:Uncharacterized protein n=1 Tax=Saccharolobus solfataricus TaxID=2287 RepID=A0A157T1P7_SACSO|nr:hypothetical protein [Saccharolobus solfataricus]QPG48762.1 hypothetical protein HFC64_01105 [Saccharolobus solfataricus]SAI84818.1 uncharacterised protein [Saccharolobus solfataricus]